MKVYTREEFRGKPTEELRRMLDAALKNEEHAKSVLARAMDAGHLSNEDLQVAMKKKYHEVHVNLVCLLEEVLAERSRDESTPRRDRLNLILVAIGVLVGVATLAWSIFYRGE